LLAGFALGGCSWVGDRTGIDLGGRSAPSAAAPGANQPYPNLANVPNRPEAGTARQRLDIEQGLLADRTNARYVSGPVAAPERVNPFPETARAVQPTIIDPGSGRPPATERGESGAAPRVAARPELPVLGPGGAVGSIAFRAGSTALAEGSGRVIVRAAEAHRRLGGVVVVNSFSAREEGTPAARRANAEARANVVVDGLLNLGVPGDRIRAAVADAAAEESRIDIAIVGTRR
jgi:hypothetical protein